jgi:hypothetical protein
MPSCNTTLEDQSTDGEVPLFSVVTFHHVGLVVSAVFALISVIISFFLIAKHATHYSKPWEQRQYVCLVATKVRADSVPQHYPNPPHDPHLLDRVLPLVLLLPPLNLL